MDRRKFIRMRVAGLTVIGYRLGCETSSDVIGIKISGAGKRISESEREQSINYVVTQGNVHCVTLGLESESQMYYAIEWIMRNAQNI
jgi:hypothetical protein